MDIMRLKNQGLSKRAIAKRLGISRDTVAKYWEQKELVQPQYAKRPRLIDSFTDYITNRLQEYPELSAETLFHEIQKQGYTGSERTVRRYLGQVRPREYREYKPFETLPGEQAQADWGHFGNIIIEGSRYKLYAFVLTMGHCRASYVEFVVDAGMATFLACLHRAFTYLGGVPREVLFDNAKVVVSERVGSAVRFNDNLLQFALATGFSPRACWHYDAPSKGKVESQVKYVRQGFFYGLEFEGLKDLNARAREWLEERANVRVHGTTGKVPAEELVKERAYLKAPPESLELPFILEKRQVTRTGLISVGNNRYSVPYRFARGTLWFRRFERHLEVLEGRQVVDTIPLSYGKNRRIIRDEHYPEHQKKREGSRHPLQAKFESLAPEAGDYLAGLVQSGVGTIRDQMEKIVSLSEDHPSEAMSRAMQRALKHRAYGYGKLKSILKLPAEPLYADRKAAAPLARTLDVNVERRDLSYYQVEGESP